MIFFYPMSFIIVHDGEKEAQLHKSEDKTQPLLMNLIVQIFLHINV